METSQEFKEWYRELNKQPNVRVQFKELFKRTKATVASEKQLSLEVVLLIARLDRDNGAVNLGFASTAKLAEALGITENMFWKRAQVGRVVSCFPEVWEMLKRGETHMSQVSMIAPKFTERNKDMLLAAIKHKSERQVKEILSTITRDGRVLKKEPELELRLKFTKSQMERLDRAREVLSARGQVPSQEEVLLKALEDLLEKRDPVKRAERAEKRQQRKETKNKAPSARNDKAYNDTPPSDTSRECPSVKKEAKIPERTSAHKKDRPSAPQEKRRAIPARVKHELIRRSEGRCMYVAPDGTRCPARGMLEVDHIKAHSLGGTDDIDNLRVLCREHNMAAAVELFGWQHMAAYKRKRHIE